MFVFQVCNALGIIMDGARLTELMAFPVTDQAIWVCN